MTDFQGGQRQEVITCDSSAPRSSPPHVHTPSSTHINRYTPPQWCTHPGVTLPGASVSRLAFQGCIPEVCLLLINSENLQFSRLRKRITFTSSPFCILFFMSLSKVLRSVCPAGFDFYLNKQKSQYPLYAKHRHANYDKSICISPLTNWPTDNKPLNCTSNWQAGKPIHSTADTET